MNTRDLDTLREAVKAEAERDRQHVLATAKAEARRILDTARAEAEAEAKRLVNAAKQHAAELKQQAMGAAQLEARALLTRKREALLDEVFAKAAEQLSHPEAIDDYPNLVPGLIADAAAHITGVDTLIVHADAYTAGLVDKSVLDQLATDLGISLTLGEMLRGGVGVVVTSGDGRLRYDNTLGTRLERMRPALRPLVYRVLIGGTQ